MTVIEAKRIGSKQGLISVSIGILTAQLIMTSMISIDQDFFKAFFWFIEVDYLPHILIGIAIMFLSGHLYGQLAGVAIIIKQKNYVLTGFITGMGVLLTTTFFASWTGFIQEGIDNIGTNSNPFFDYIFKPMYWVTLFGLIPALIVGIWFGSQIRKRGNKLKLMANTEVE